MAAYVDTCAGESFEANIVRRVELMGSKLLPGRSGVAHSFRIGYQPGRAATGPIPVISLGSGQLGAQPISAAMSILAVQAAGAAPIFTPYAS